MRLIRCIAVIQRIALSQRLLEVLDELAELDGQDPEAERTHGEPVAGEWPFGSALDGADERFVAELRTALARLAGSCRNEPPHVAAAVQDALDTTEFVVRRHLLGGRGARLPQLLPSLVYLVLSPRLGRTEARSVAGRSAQLLERRETPRRMPVELARSA
jgi:hypothetical protein